MMWLQDSEDNNLKESKCDSSYSRRLRHLLARPNAPVNSYSPSCMVPSCCCGHISNTVGFSMNHHQNSVTDDQASKDENHIEPLVSSRWNPTPEQLMALEEMYRRGVRTPSAEEIKLIAAKLRQFGRIEGKNVFYWFQNHKARERHKRRRQPDLMIKKHVNDIQTLETKETGLEAEKNKKLVTTPTCSSTSKDPGSMQRAMVTESGRDGWTHFDERELQQMNQRKITKGANPTSHRDLSYMAPTCNLLNTITKPFTPQTSGQTQQKLFTSLNFSMFSPSFNEAMINYEVGSGDHQTLQLFPPRNDDHSTIRTTETHFQELMTTINSNLPPNQFYEFL